MDPRVREVMEGAMSTCAETMRSIEELSDRKMGEILDFCYSKNPNNPDRFADCIVDKQKKIEEIITPMQFKIVFFSKNSQKCLQENKSVSACTE